MIRRLYVHNYRCLENFELKLEGISSALLIGHNGSGKSTVGRVFSLLQRVGRGQNRVGELISPDDFCQNRAEVPIRFEVEVLLDEQVFTYVLAFELPTRFKELRILTESLSVEGTQVFSRDRAEVSLRRNDQSVEFLVDWHMVALPMIQEQSPEDPLLRFKTWLSKIIILAPIPQQMNGTSETESAQPDKHGKNFAAWLSGLLGRFPAAYATMAAYLSVAMPDLLDFRHDPTGKSSKNLVVRFRPLTGGEPLELNFQRLSDGEKCYFVGAVLLAVHQFDGPLFCFWDEPDAHLSLSEVGHFVMALRRGFDANGQILLTSHGPEAIRGFSDENTLLLSRRSHLEPTTVRRMSDISVDGDLVGALIRGDLEDGGQ